MTPLTARIGKKLVESLRHPTVVRDLSALETFPVRPVGFREAIARALRNEDHAFAQTRWSDALSSGVEAPDWSHTRFGARIVDSRVLDSPHPPKSAFAPIRRIGGQTGWYYADWLWRLRGFLDLLVGGVGVRRGRPHPERLRVGDTLDWWRVERIEPDRVLRLAAEMKLPGRAWLEFEVNPNEHGSRVRQTAIFDPVGLGGLLYWYGLWPFHALVFRGMLRKIVAAGHRGASA